MRGRGRGSRANSGHGAMQAGKGAKRLRTHNTHQLLAPRAVDHGCRPVPPTHAVAFHLLQAARESTRGSVVGSASAGTNLCGMACSSTRQVGIPDGCGLCARSCPRQGRLLDLGVVAGDPRVLVPDKKSHGRHGRANKQAGVSGSHEISITERAQSRDGPYLHHRCLGDPGLHLAKQLRDDSELGKVQRCAGTVTTTYITAS